jgi:HK97 family phage major capsid protein
MAIKAKDLRHKAGQLAKRQAEILEKAVDQLTPEQETEFDTLHEEEQTLLKQAKKIEAVEQINHEEEESAKEVEKILQPGDLAPEKKKEAEVLAMKSYLLTGEVPEELRTFMKKTGKESDDRSMITSELKKLGLVRANQQSTTDGSGGYTIPQGFQYELEKAMKEFGGIYEQARILKTTSGNPIDWPTVNDTANRAYQLSEAGNTETSAEKFTDSTMPLAAYKWTSGLLRLSSELIQDSAFNMATVVVDLLSERIARGINYGGTLGTGSSQPQGVTVGAAYGVSFSTQGSPSYDQIVNLEHACDPAYRKNGRFMFHDKTLAVIKKLKDSQNLPVWLASMRESEPQTIFGKPYTINQDMAYGATNSAKIMLFGDFKKFILRQVADMRIVRLNERFADTDEVGFVVFFRWDSRVLNAGTNPIVYGRNDAT